MYPHKTKNWYLLFVCVCTMDYSKKGLTDLSDTQEGSYPAIDATIREESIPVVPSPKPLSFLRNAAASASSLKS